MNKWDIVKIINFLWELKDKFFNELKVKDHWDIAIDLYDKLKKSIIYKNNPSELNFNIKDVFELLQEIKSAIQEDKDFCDFIIDIYGKKEVEPLLNNLNYKLT